MKIKHIFHTSDWPLSIHLFLNITLLFAFFILIQQAVSYNIFNNFYLNTQIKDIQSEKIDQYIIDLNNNNTTPIEFNKNNIAYSCYLSDLSSSSLTTALTEEQINNNIDDVIILDEESSYTNHVCFINKLNNDEIILTVFSIQATSTMLNTLNTYNIYVYIFIFIIICFSSWWISKSVITPIENITEVAKEIASLNFTRYSQKINSRETKALSNSINLVNDNLKQTIEQLNVKNEEANQLAIKQKEQFQMKKKLVSAISHELKTPLAVMQASISGILDGVFEPEENEKELQNVLKEINHTNEMVLEVLDVYRLDNESFTLELEHLDIVYFTQKIINSFDTVLKNSNTSTKFFFDQKNLKINGDYRQLKRVISNLLVNAIKYSPEYQTVNISIKLRKGKILFEVSNYGVTIPQEDIKNVFEPFYRVDKSGNRTEKRKGSGLGLYIVKEILEKHNFEYGIKNIENGVTFYFIADEVSNS